MFVSCAYCVLSGRGLCDELITRPEESYRLLRAVVCDQEILWTRRSQPALGCRARENNNNTINNNINNNKINNNNNNNNADIYIRGI
jgi:hypothetical protein